MHRSEDLKVKQDQGKLVEIPPQRPGRNIRYLGVQMKPRLQKSLDVIAHDRADIDRLGREKTVLLDLLYVIHDQHIGYPLQL